MNKTILNNKGFSLIEIAIGITIASLIMVGILSTLKAEEKRQRHAFTVGNLSKIESAINQYYTENGAYPKPANLSFTETNPNFGKEESWGNNPATIAQCTSGSWFATNGICRTTINPTIAAVVGGVPFAALHLNIEDSLDGWHNKIIYVVTEVKTDPVRFPNNNGTISVQAFNGAGVMVAVDTIEMTDFLVLSTGKTGRGGYTKDAILINACGTVAVNGNESENCDFDSVFTLEIHPTDVLAESLFSDLTGVNAYDDLIAREIKPATGKWYPPANASTDMVTISTRIGIGTTNPQSAIHVIGDIMVNNDIMSDSICDENELNCFDPNLITGTDPDMRCDSGGIMFGDQPMMDIALSKVGCASAIDSGGNPIDGKEIKLNMATYNSIDCFATGKLVTGFNASGDPICVTP